LHPIRRTIVVLGMAGLASLVGYAASDAVHSGRPVPIAPVHANLLPDFVTPHNVKVTPLPIDRGDAGALSTRPRSLRHS
jgi:hypothetical protein